jgi:NAD(P)-dependent dehydrogenase (short-subunit alcohol dehydrogenase family)
MKSSMKGKTVLATGATNGIGLVTARELARMGAQTGRNLAESPQIEGVTGKYFFDYKAINSNLLSHDMALTGKLWLVRLESTGEAI